MDKRNWKKVVAREWLFLLGFAVGSAALAALVLLVFTPKSVPSPGPRPTPEKPWLSGLSPNGYPGKKPSQGNAKTESRLVLDWLQMVSVSNEDAGDSLLRAKGVSEYLIQNIRDYCRDTTTVRYTSVGATADFLRYRLDRWSADWRSYTAEWERASKAYTDFINTRELVRSVAVLLLVIPYPLFLFTRTIIWSIRQVRVK